jgi:hypothetical protein
MIYAYKEKDENGQYQTPSGVRFNVTTAARVAGPWLRDWREFESKEAALKYWRLEPVPVPEEETLTETE